jgi:predicted permease
MVIGRILGIFCIILIGVVANKIGWLPVEAGRHLARVVLNIAAPCVVISAMSSQELTDGNLHSVLLLLGVGVVQYAIVFALSFPLVRLLRPPKEDRGIYRNFFAFSNNGFMGFPVTLAVFGSLGMFYMVVLNSLLNVFMFTVGLWNVRRGVKSAGEVEGDAGRAADDIVARGRPGRPGTLRGILKDLINPVNVALFVGFFLFLMQIRLPDAVLYTLDSLGAMMAPLSMIVIGLQLTESKFSAVIMNRRLIAMTLIRLIGLGVLGFAILFPLYVNGVISPILLGILTLNLILPCAAVPVMFAEEYGGNVKIAAEGTFLSTLFSIVTIPIFGALLSML